MGALKSYTLELEYSIEVKKFVKYLLKEKGITINGVKKILNNPNNQSIDHNDALGVYKRTSGSTLIIKEKVKNISKIIKELKKVK